MSIDPAQVAAVFDDWAERGRAEGMERGHGRAARAGFERLECSPDTRYLDIGCGNGYTVRWAAESSPGVSAHGIDISPRMIERAREQSAELSNCSFVCGAFPHPRFEAGGFDRIFSMEVLYYLPDLEGALAEVFRLLAPGGRFVCIVDHYAENTASHSWGPDMGLSLHLESEARWRELFASAGFAAIEQTRIRAPRDADDSWKHTEGSLLTLGSR